MGDFSVTDEFVVVLTLLPASRDGQEEPQSKERAAKRDVVCLCFAAPLPPYTHASLGAATLKHTGTTYVQPQHSQWVAVGQEVSGAHASKQRACISVQAP